MLTHAARSAKDHSTALVTELRDLLRNLDPGMLERAARQSFLLVDMGFRNGDLWHPSRLQTDRRMRSPLSFAFPRASAIQLARATLIHARLSLWNDPFKSPVLLGMTPPVADVVGNLTLEDIETLAHTRFRQVHPRWDDRLAVWRRLLKAAQTADEQLMHEYHVHALQLLTGEFVAP